MWSEESVDIAALMSRRADLTKMRDNLHVSMKLLSNDTAIMLKAMAGCDSDEEREALWLEGLANQEVIMFIGRKFYACMAELEYLDGIAAGFVSEDGEEG